MKLFLKVLNVAVTVGLVLIILVSGAMAITAKRSADRIPTVAGFKVLTVLSGSMEPAINTGDVILVKPLAPTDVIQENDVITFRANAGSDMLITHRVVGIVNVNGKPSAYVTKGDANDSNDLSAIPVDRVMGTYRFRVPYFGFLGAFIRKPVGIVLCVIVPGLLLIISEVVKMWKALAEEEAAKKRKDSHADEAAS